MSSTGPVSLWSRLRTFDGVDNPLRQGRNEDLHGRKARRRGATGRGKDAQPATCDDERTKSRRAGGETCVFVELVTLVTLSWCYRSFFSSRVHKWSGERVPNQRVVKPVKPHVNQHQGAFRDILGPVC